ncbi:hypothetical protein V0U79_13145 [Hyphobacterium sp. HN65]|uniref:Sel1 repeat family protein n=1 Tax=Hyphobacterium lacteum TaxID=3116575 RepID=A0ABU7LTR2_9PROT|nr:hypothetical protein [Hyphobacterium sp. HN65]MEE2527306.1 hypothetical protein [Hyphobacterium sp. HN65]
MKHALLALALAALVSACASNNNESTFRGGAGGDAAYGRGLQALERGDHAEAHDYFICAAQFGSGYEVAWYYAGTTALEVARAGGDDADEYRATGEEYLTRSGLAGWGASQAALARHYHEIGNPQEAAYWALLYTNNVREISLGLTRMDDETIIAIRDGVTAEELAEAEARATRFVPDPLPVGRASAECAEAIQSDRERPQRARIPVREQRQGPPQRPGQRPGSPY